MLVACLSVTLVEQDPAAAEQAWEEIVRRLESEGFAVEPAERLGDAVEPEVGRPSRA